MEGHIYGGGGWKLVYVGSFCLERNEVCGGVVFVGVENAGGGSMAVMAFFGVQM